MSLLLADRRAEVGDLGDRPEGPIGRVDAGAPRGGRELALEPGGGADDQEPGGGAAAVGERVGDPPGANASSPPLTVTRSR